MNGFEACKIMLALKLHFTTKSYDFSKYNGEVSLTVDGYKTRKDKYFCEKLARKYPSRERLIDFASTVYAKVSHPKKLWTTDFFKKENIDLYDSSIAWTDAYEYHFEQELITIIEAGIDNSNDINWALSIKNIPPIINMFFKGTISLEWLCMFDSLTNLAEDWQNYSHIKDDIFFEEFSTRIIRFRPFFFSRIGLIDLHNIRHIMYKTAEKYKLPPKS